MNTDKNKDNSILFIDIIHKINQLLNVINQLVIKGDIKMHQYLIKLTNKQITILNNDGEENNTSLNDIIKNCHTRLENIIATQKQMYQKENNTELTYLYGKWLKDPDSHNKELEYSIMNAICDMQQNVA